MEASMNTSERAEVSPQSELFCDLCGYSRRGIPREARCPECGELPTLIPVESLLEQYRSAGELYWLRSVAVGLGLLLAASGVCLAVALVMPVYGFSLAAVSFVGPKIGAVALIERSLGSAPGPWGVAGVMGLLAQLAGVWFLTERRSVRGNEESFWTLRRIARWTAVICVGAAVGRLLGFDSNGIGDDGAVRSKLYFCLIVGELP